jgi:phosphohistidine phosphatase
MKELYLLRHAKSSWDLDLDDYYRPLNERGYKDADRMGRYLNEKKLHFDLVLSSPAIRAYSTALIFCNSLKMPGNEIVLREDLYETKVHDYLKCLSEIENCNKVLLAGHNNTITEVAQKITHDRVNELKTCTIIGISFNFPSWKDILHSKGKLLFELSPESIESW